MGTRLDKTIIGHCRKTIAPQFDRTSTCARGAPMRQALRLSGAHPLIELGSLSIVPQEQHLLLGHRLHRPRYATDAVTRLAPSRERHPIGTKCRVVVDQNGRRIEALRGP